MGVFTKSSLTFFVLNFLRLISVVAICMAFSGEIVTLVADLKGVEAAKATPTPSSTAGTRLLRREMDPRPLFTPSASISTPTSAPTAMATIVRRERITSTSVEEQSSTARPRASSTRVMTASNVAASASATSCSYIGNTSVPKEVGGILFSTLERLFCAIILLFALLAECPPPSQWTQRFWAYAFPPFGEKFGTGVLGIVQIFIGCVALSHSTTGFPLVAFWFLFIVGFLNVLFGLAFGAPLNSLRSILPSPSSPSSVSGLKSLRANAAPPAGAASSYFGFEAGQDGPAPPKPSKARKVGIQISPPVMVQHAAPPVY